MIRGLLIAAALAGAATAAQAAPAHPPGDFTGVWMPEPDSYLGAKLTPPAPLTPAMIAMRQRRAAAQAKGYVRNAGGMLCQGGGGPALSMVRSPFVVMQGFGRLTFTFETEVFNQPRTVYLEQKTQPDNIFPSDNGHSIGRFEGRGAGRVLVVDTVGFNGNSKFPSDIPASDKAHIVERFSLSADGQRLTDQITMTDPDSLTGPWTVSLHYHRMPDTEERIEVTCEPDLEAFNKLDLPSLKDADPDVARLLDPARAPGDPAWKIAKPGT